MAFSFRPATREGVHLIVGFFGGTGSGKTYSAMRLASGLADGKRFAVIDTEAGRAQHYADSFTFDHGDLRAPFRPRAYLDAIAAADKAGYPVVVVDSMSHEHAGEGGLLDWHEEEFQRLGGREAVKMTAWIKPKMAHKAMVQHLLQLRCHLILCCRAEPKVRMEKDAQGKMQVIDDGWRPICAKGLEFEMTASFLLSHETPGLPNAPLKLPQALRACFPPTVPIDEDAGRRIAAWASGGVPASTPAATNGGRAGSAAPAGAADKLVVAFAKLGVTAAQIAERLGHPVASATAAEVAALRATWKAISDGRENWTASDAAERAAIEAEGAAVENDGA